LTNGPQVNELIVRVTKREVTH